MTGGHDYLGYAAGPGPMVYTLPPALACATYLQPLPGEAPPGGAGAYVVVPAGGSLLVVPPPGVVFGADAGAAAAAAAQQQLAYAAAESQPFVMVGRPGTLAAQQLAAPQLYVRAAEAGAQPQAALLQAAPAYGTHPSPYSMFEAAGSGVTPGGGGAMGAPRRAAPPPAGAWHGGGGGGAAARAPLARAPCDGEPARGGSSEGSGGGGGGGSRRGFYLVTVEDVMSVLSGLGHGRSAVQAVAHLLPGLESRRAGGGVGG
jgi:hypothetical protein